MKTYQSTLGDFKTSSLWSNCITDMITGENNKIYDSRVESKKMKNIKKGSILHTENY